MFGKRKAPYGGPEDTPALNSASDTVTRNASKVDECLETSHSSDDQYDIGEIDHWKNLIRPIRRPINTMYIDPILFSARWLGSFLYKWRIYQGRAFAFQLGVRMRRKALGTPCI